jgi:hypothetical protein
MAWLWGVLVFDASIVFVGVELVETLDSGQMRLIWEFLYCLAAGFAVALLIFVGAMGILAKINPELL